MKKENLIKNGLFTALVAGTMISCGGEETPVTDPVNNDTQEIVAETEDLSIDLESFGVDESIQYTVPTPNEFLESVSMGGGEPNFEVLNNPDNAGDYSDKKTKALNFGVYSADLAYAINFNASPSVTSKYFTVVNKMATDLDMATAIDVAMAEKSEEFLNAGMNDSVKMIGDQTYYKAYSYLEENGRGDALAMVVAGGWVEGLYLMCNMVNDYEADAGLIEAISAQTYTVESIMGFLNKYRTENEDVARIMKDIEPVAEILANVGLEEEGMVEMVEEDGEILLTGGDSMLLSKEDFEALKAKVTELRESITE